MCKCVLYYCQWVSTQLQLTNISYHNTKQQSTVDPPSTADFFNRLYKKRCKVINLNNELEELSYVITTVTLKILLLYDYLYNVVSIVTSHGLDDLVSIPCRSKRCSCSPKRPEEFCSLPNLLCNNYLAAFPPEVRKPVRETAHSHLDSSLRMSGAITPLPHMP